MSSATFPFCSEEFIIRSKGSETFSMEQTTNKYINSYTGTSPLHYEPASHLFLSQSLGCLCAKYCESFQQQISSKNCSKCSVPYNNLRNWKQAEYQSAFNKPPLDGGDTSPPQTLDFHRLQSRKFKNVKHHKIIP